MDSAHVDVFLIGLGPIRDLDIPGSAEEGHAVFIFPIREQDFQIGDGDARISRGAEAHKKPFGLGNQFVHMITP